jgi:hypothetical protein
MEDIRQDYLRREYEELCQVHLNDDQNEEFYLHEQAIKSNTLPVPLPKTV